MFSWGKEKTVAWNGLKLLVASYGKYFEEALWKVNGRHFCWNWAITMRILVLTVVCFDFWLAFHFSWTMPHFHLVCKKCNFTDAKQNHIKLVVCHMPYITVEFLTFCFKFLFKGTKTLCLFFLLTVPRCSLEWLFEKTEKYPRKNFLVESLLVRLQTET